MADRIETELNRLANATTPAPDIAAKARAVTLALAAFDDAQAQKKQMAGTQGSRNGWRFTDALKHLWSLPMNKKHLAGTVAAALIVIPAAGLTAYQMRSDFSSPSISDSGGMSMDASTTQPNRASGSPTMQGMTEFVYSNKRGVPEVNRMETRIDMTQAVVAELRPRRMSGFAPGGAPALDMSTPPEVSAPRFTSSAVNAFQDVASEPVSTFSADVDTSSYAVARRMILNGLTPDPDSVRIEEMVNYFPYDWNGPTSAETPFQPNVTVLPTPWNRDTKLVHIGIKGYDLAVAEQAPSNLVFLIDVSGSMAEADKLPLLKSSLRMLLNKLKPSDTVSIVTYAGSARVALEPTRAENKASILAVIDGLEAGGGTAGADGLSTAYDLAERSYIKNGVNRIMLVTDGDFNVGPSSDEDLKRIVETKRKSGIFLSVLGFGGEYYNDGLMQTLAQNGNGVAAYIDTLSEAQKTLVQEASSSMFTIAKDVKFQVEFNPDKVSEYRLIGYETRTLKREDFNNDKVDAGDIGSGHTVTAIYEIIPKGSTAHSVDKLRYGAPQGNNLAATGSDEMAFVKLRYKTPGEVDSRLIAVPVASSNEVALESASPDVKFSIAVAAYGQKLKREDAVADYRWKDIKRLAEQGRGPDPYGYRSEFLKLVDIVASLPQGSDDDEAQPHQEQPTKPLP
jgi:Ca-activated chloride channel family protein